MMNRTLGRSLSAIERWADASIDDKPAKVMIEKKYKYKSVMIGRLLRQVHEWIISTVSEWLHIIQHPDPPAISSDDQLPISWMDIKILNGY